MDEIVPELDANYIADNKDDNYDDATRPNKREYTIRRSKRVKDSLHLIAALTANEKAEMPYLSIKNKQLVSGWDSANLDLQMKEWVFKDHITGAVVDNKTGKKLEYRDLIKRPELKERWSTSLTNELGRLAQGIQDISGTNPITFIKKSNIPVVRRKEVTYGRLVVGYKPDETEKYRSGLTV